MDALAALRLQIAWGADEALDDVPVDRTQAAPRPAALSATPPPLAPAAQAARPGPAVRAQIAADAAPDVAALRAALAAFTECPLAVTATNLVFADGNPDARIVLVSDVPGPDEDMSGIPLSGPAGTLLDSMLASIGLDRTGVLITSLIPWRPPGGRPPTDGEVAMCLPFLMRHLALVQPGIVVPLGALPAKHLTGNDSGIRKLRGKLVNAQLKGVTGEVKLLPMFHPSHLLRTPVAKKEAWTDLLALQRLLNPS